MTKTTEDIVHICQLTMRVRGLDRGARTTARDVAKLIRTVVADVNALVPMSEDEQKAVKVELCQRYSIAGYAHNI
jgi:hypothetical protein